LPEPKAIEVVVRDEPIAYTRSYRGRGNIKLMIGESGALARIRYEPAEAFPGVERVRERLRRCPLCLVAETIKGSQSRANSGDGGMPTWKEVGLIVGGQHIAKGIERGLVELDRALGKEGAPVHERPSTWINTVGGVALVLLPRFVRMPEEADFVLTALGGHMTTKVWDYVEEAMAPAATAPAYTPAPAVFAPASSGAQPAAQQASAPAKQAVGAEVF